jgi:PIN domain nuclease of toxin-antitoxin system
MRLLVDAHALLWWLGDDARLSAGAREAIETSEQALIGAGTLMEIAIKRSLGKLEAGDDWVEQAQADDFLLHPISWAHAAHLQRLPYVKIAKRPHRDPFDRLLAAQALSDAIPVVTCDPAIEAYGPATIW